MNLFIATGNLGKDCEIKYLPSGSAICTFSLPVKSGYGDKQKTTWIECALFGKKAEGKLPDYLLKGQGVCVSGEIFMDEFKGQDGATKRFLKMNIDKLDLIGGQPKEGSNRPTYSGPRPSDNQQPPPADMDKFDDDIPF